MFQFKQLRFHTEHLTEEISWLYPPLTCSVVMRITGTMPVKVSYQESVTERPNELWFSVKVNLLEILKMPETSYIAWSFS